jgi:hypothetical protein
VGEIRRFTVKSAKIFTALKSKAAAFCRNPRAAIGAGRRFDCRFEATFSSAGKAKYVKLSATTPFMQYLFFLFAEPAAEIVRNAPLDRLWLFLPVGYLTTILIETPILLFGLPGKLSLKQKLLCGIWLTACTYPIVVLVLPALLMDYSRNLYLIVAETFAPVGECLFFWLAFRASGLFETKDWRRSFAAIVAANLASFGIGEIINYYQWFGLF